MEAITNTGEEKMEGMSVADAMALNKDQGFGDQVWPLVWLAALGGGNGILGGGNNNAAAGATVAGLEGLQNQVNGLLDTINANTSVLQHEAVQAQLCGMATLIQSGNADITSAICKCCCDLKQQICDLGYKIETGNASIRADICAQTNNLTMQNMTNTRDILDAVHREGMATRELINLNTINEKDEKINKCERELSEQRIIAALGSGGHPHHP